MTPFEAYREYVAFVQADMKLTGGPLTNTFAAYFRAQAKKQKPDGDQDELNSVAKQIYNDEKKNGKLQELFNKIKKSYEEKREKKKMEKKEAKAAAKIAAKNAKV